MCTVADQEAGAAEGQQELNEEALEALPEDNMAAIAGFLPPGMAQPDPAGVPPCSRMIDVTFLSKLCTSSCHGADAAGKTLMCIGGGCLSNVVQVPGCLTGLHPMGLATWMWHLVLPHELCAF